MQSRGGGAVAESQVHDWHISQSLSLACDVMLNVLSFSSTRHYMKSSLLNSGHQNEKFRICRFIWFRYEFRIHLPAHIRVR